MTVDSLRDRDDSERNVCPGCDSTQVVSKAPSHGSQERIHPEDYYCKNCDTHLDDPDREVRERREPYSGLAARLSMLGEAMDDSVDGPSIEEIKEGNA